MKIGDVVARAYSWKELVSGIIVAREEETIHVGDNGEAHRYDYAEVNFIVLWSDGTTSKEMYEELMFFKEAHGIR